MAKVGKGGGGGMPMAAPQPPGGAAEAAGEPQGAMNPFLALMAAMMKGGIKGQKWPF